MLAVEVDAWATPAILEIRSFGIDRTNRLHAQSPSPARRRTDAPGRLARPQRPCSAPDRADARGAQGAVVQRRRVIGVKIHPLSSLQGAERGRGHVYTCKRDPSLRLPAHPGPRELFPGAAGFGPRGLAHGGFASSLTPKSYAKPQLGRNAGV